MTRQTDCRLAQKPTVRSSGIHLGTGHSHQMPVQGREVPVYDFEPAAVLRHKVGTRPDRFAGGLTGPHRWSGTWSGDELTEADLPDKGACLDQSGGLCPRFAEARARQTLAERQLVEFNHRLLNMLQVLVSRIERQRRMQDDPGSQDGLAGLAAIVRASARLHRSLLPPRQDGLVDLGAALGNVAAAIEVVNGLLCEVEVEPVAVPGRIAMHLAAAVNELAWNAHKHAYHGAEGGLIRIVCRREADEWVLLSVADRGCGVPADFDPRASDGLGLMVVCATARQFGGELRVESDRGTCFTLLLNIPGLEWHLP